MSTKQFDEAVNFLEDFHVNWSKSEEIPVTDTLTQAIDALALTAPTYTIVASQFDSLGLDPKTLIGNYVTAHSINEPHIGFLIFGLMDGSQILLHHQYRYPGEVPSPNQPRIMIDNALNKILRAHKVDHPLQIKNAAIGMRKKGGPQDGKYSGREHRVIGFQLDGMDEMGWVELAVQQNHQCHYFDLIAAQRW